MKTILVVLVLASSCVPSDAPVDNHPTPNPEMPDASIDGSVVTPPSASNRDRLITSYLSYLKANPAKQSNGLQGSSLNNVCELWTTLDPSSRATFLTITARLEGSIIDADGTTMLDHVTKLYRVNGGEAATATDPGSCGGGEYNRLIMSMDTKLHTALVTAFNDAGIGAHVDIHDMPTNGYWRDSHDLGGPHAPFNHSDETNDGAPRGQTQYFADPTSTLANTALNRQDLTTLVDPYALEMDEDYNCPHDSNPLCSYTTYGPACFPESSTSGVDLFTQNYGNYLPTWKPAGC